MAFLLKKNAAFSRFQSSSSQKTEDSRLQSSRRMFHVEPGAREKALLEPDPALKRYKSHVKSVKILKRVGDIVTVAVAAGCCYEIYVKAVQREEARKKAGTTAN